MPTKSEWVKDSKKWHQQIKTVINMSKPKLNSDIPCFEGFDTEGKAKPMQLTYKICRRIGPLVFW